MGGRRDSGEADDDGAAVSGGGADPRRHAPATQRNREPILEVLYRVLPASGRVLELASGTGEHAVWFAHALRPLVWVPSDPDPEMRRSIAAHAASAQVRTLETPLDIDVTRRPWPVAHADAVVCINLLHIAPWAASEGLMAGAAEVLPTDAPLYVYGPFTRDGAHTAESNARFDESLRASDPAWGVRDVAEVTAEAERRGLALDEVVEMPANNLSLVFRKS